MSQKQKPGVVVAGIPSRPEHFEAAGLVPAWALGRTAADHTMSERERKLTAAMYVQLPGVLEHVRKEGRLPPQMKPAGGAEIGLRILVQRRGLDIELSESERAVFDAIGASGVPAGCVVLLGS